MIAQRDLSIISNNLLKENGGRRIPEQSIELDYALGWFLAKLAQHPYGEKLAFKGGTALRRCHLGEYRFSEDLDFTLLNDDDFDTVTKAFDEVAAGVAQETGMAFSYRGPDRVSHENSHTFYMGFTGPMDRPREFKVDVTRTECIVAHLERKPVIVTYPVFDFPGDCAVKVYSIDEIVTEKLLALTDTKRTQPRDLFDVWTLATDVASVSIGWLTPLPRSSGSAAGARKIYLQLSIRRKRCWRRHGELGWMPRCRLRRNSKPCSARRGQH